LVGKIMKKLGLLILIAALQLSGTIVAQDSPKPFTMVVQVDSAFVHAAPAEDAERIASVFEDNKLEAVGRNLDGTWFEVRRPGRLTNLGWIFNKMVDWDFAP
jgi:hypothetical protein